MTLYLAHARELLEDFKGYRLKQIPQQLNSNIDTLACSALVMDTELTRLIPVEFLSKANITKLEYVHDISLLDGWMQPIVAFLKGENIPSDSKEFQKMSSKCTNYALWEGEL